jgi:hypothetical protein
LEARSIPSLGTCHAMPQSDRFIRITWWIAIATVVVNCVFWFSYWSLIDVATPFEVPILRLPLLAVTFVAVVVAVILPFRRWKPCGIATLLPLGFLIGCFGLSRLVDFTDVWLAANFRLHLADREEVVGLIASGKLRPNVRSWLNGTAISSRFCFSPSAACSIASPGSSTRRIIRPLWTATSRADSPSTGGLMRDGTTFRHIEPTPH